MNPDLGKQASCELDLCRLSASDDTSLQPHQDQDICSDSGVPSGDWKEVLTWTYTHASMCGSRFGDLGNG